ncbi:hypothetical protein MRB53_019074 [Persea americana]|uniref:Uncharacterized protein n=1 Tax=Persea americana TaxID=3435 RepID=A0ACC2M9P3_PERAE|nr:hypothetical protein MRB53_019074 [Persea americana]
MHGISSIAFSSHTHLPLSLPFLENIVKSSIPTCRHGHGFGFQLSLRTTHFQALWNCSSRKRNKRKVALLRAGLKESPYDVLGVSPSATPNEIKRAYRKLALKLHPDVNKEANAQEKFMRIKHAYNMLMNPESQRKYDFRNRTSNYSTSESNRSSTAQDEEDFYGFGNFLRDVQITIEDFFRDMQTEFQNWEASAASQGKPKSLWEELADIGEEFVEFLEKELNINDSNEDMENKDNQSTKTKPHDETGQGTSKNDIQNEAGKEKSTIEENIDEIEAALAQLKRELGL